MRPRQMWRPRPRILHEIVGKKAHPGHGGPSTHPCHRQRCPATHSSVRDPDRSAEAPGATAGFTLRKAPTDCHRHAGQFYDPVAPDPTSLPHLPIPPVNPLTPSARARSSTSKWDPKCLLDPPSQGSQRVIHNYAGTTNETQFKNLKIQQAQAAADHDRAGHRVAPRRRQANWRQTQSCGASLLRHLAKQPAVLHKLLATAYLFGN